MKRLLLLAVFLPVFGFSQDCLPDGITFTTQEQIDNFQENYPNCTLIEGNVEINSYDITNLNGLNMLTIIEGNLNIDYNYTLSSLSGLENLIYVGGDLAIQVNPLIENLNSLSNLNTIGGDNGGDIFISYNESLTELSGLENLNPNLIKDLTITFNFLLTYCEIESVCSYLAAPSGEIFIGLNSLGCSSQEEIENACFSNTNEIDITRVKIKISPNPAKDDIAIFCPPNVKISEVCIFSQAGNKLVCKKGLEKTIDISELSPGLYFIEISHNSGLHREKLIIQ